MTDGKQEFVDDNNLGGTIDTRNINVIIRLSFGVQGLRNRLGLYPVG